LCCNIYNKSNNKKTYDSDRACTTLLRTKTKAVCYGAPTVISPAFSSPKTSRNRVFIVSAWRPIDFVFSRPKSKTNLGRRAIKNRDRRFFYLFIFFTSLYILSFPDFFWNIYVRGIYFIFYMPSHTRLRAYKKIRETHSNA